MQITYHVEPDEKTGGFIAYCPAIKPASIYAKTQEEIAPKMKAAIGIYLKLHPEIKEKLQTHNNRNVIVFETKMKYLRYNFPFSKRLFWI